MSYFKLIQTNGNGSEFDITKARHEQALNNYVKYGSPYDDSAYSKLSEVYKNPNWKKPKVEGHSTTSMEHNNYFVITTTLCCEDETDEAER